MQNTKCMLVSVAELDVCLLCLVCIAMTITIFLWIYSLHGLMTGGAYYTL